MKGLANNGSWVELVNLKIGFLRNSYFLRIATIQSYNLEEDVTAFNVWFDKWYEFRIGWLGIFALKTNP